MKAMKRMINICSGMKTYSTAENAEKAYLKKFGDCDVAYIIVKLDKHNSESEKWYGRYVPVALGEKAIQNGIHFHFHIIG